MPYLYFDIGAAVLCASFMSFGVKRRWFALGAALQLAISTYAAYVGGYVHYGDWLKVSAQGLGDDLQVARPALTPWDGERGQMQQCQSMGKRGRKALPCKPFFSECGN